jgi:RsiW-degrading membrane proteinase PrsW (M82 family)
MKIENIIIALFPLVLFYLIYFRYFSIKTSLSKMVQSFLVGINAALLIIILAPVFIAIITTINPALFLPNSIVKGFIEAALIEKLLALGGLLLILKYYPRFSVLEGTLAAMMYGIGFSFIENITYALLFGRSVIILRVIYSVPLHLTTCGILGFYLSMRHLCRSRWVRFRFLSTGFLVSFFLHGIFDTFLMLGGSYTYFTALLLIVLVITLEFMLARSQNSASRNYLKASKINFEDWLTISKQPGFERWIMRSSGRSDIQQTALFQWKPGILRFLFVILFIVLALYGINHQEYLIHNLLELKLTQAEQITLLGILPALISLILILVGAINPRFFTESELKIPIISDVETIRKDSIEETYITYELTQVNCFLKTPERIGIGKTLNLLFRFGNKNTVNVKCLVIWENHYNRQDPLGTLVLFQKPGLQFRLFYAGYVLYRYWKGFLFNLKFPGYEITRRLFMRPISTMQNDRLYNRGDIIFNQFDSGEEFYLLKKGTVLFYKKKKDSEDEIVTMGTISSGEIFGEMALLGENSRAA